MLARLGSVWTRLATLALMLAAAAGPVTGQTIHTAGKTGAYHSHFCPALSSVLDQHNYNPDCRTSDGTADNLRQISQQPSHFGYGQFDVFALNAQRYGGRQQFEIVRNDDVRECVFAATRRKDMTNYGEVAVFASQLRFYLPPRGSGSAGTFQFLQQIDPEGLALAQKVRLMASPDAAIRAALKDPDGVAFFVQFADPRNARFKLIQDLGGHVVPVIDAAILAQRVDGRPIYHAQETQVTNSKWLRAGQTVITACTPLLLLTGAASRLKDVEQRRAHQRLIDTIRAMRAQTLLPAEPLFARILKRTKQLSAQGVDRLVTLSRQARDRAKPLVDRAQKAGSKLIERAKDGADHLINRAKPNDAQ